MFVCCQSRLTPEMEKKIFFLTNNTKFGMHKRYQEWFQHKVSQHKHKLIHKAQSRLRIIYLLNNCSVILVFGNPRISNTSG